MANEDRAAKAACGHPTMMAVVLPILIPMLAVAGRERLAGQQPIAPPEAVTLPGAPAAPTSICFRGAPAAECRAFVITEVAVGYWIAPAPPSDPYRSVTDDLAVTGDFGGMVNVSDRVAVGALVGPGWTGTPWMSVKPRVRVWVSPRVALDASPGLTVLNKGLDAPRASLDVSIMFGERFGVTAQMMGISDEECVGEEYPPTCTTSEEWRMYLGARAGSDLGAWGAGLGGLAVLGTVVLVMATAGGS